MTRRVVAQVALREGTDESECVDVASRLTALETSSVGVSKSHAGVHAAGSVGGGDITWDLFFESDEALERFCGRGDRAGTGTGTGAGGGDAAKSFLEVVGGEAARVAPLVDSLVAAIPEPLGGKLSMPGLVGVKRTLWLEVLPDAPADRVLQFERETPRLAAAVPAIRNWSWSRIRRAAPNPMATRFTHLWEQEFEALEGLEVDYMSSPFHWGFIDRWFDPEMPEQVVDVRLAHLFCPATAPVLSWELEQ